MKQVSNKDMLNAIRNEASAEYQEKVPVMKSQEDVRNLERIFEAYPTAKNEFIDKLYNKVVRSDFFSKVYENPLKMLKKGTLPYGSSIEELFVAAADAKGFFANETGTGDKWDEAGELIGRKIPKVKPLYIEKNFAYVFKTSISTAMLKAAFFNENGLSSMVNQIVGSLTSGAEQREFKDMKQLLLTAANGKYIKMKSKDGDIEYTGDLKTDASKAELQAMAAFQVGSPAGADGKDIAKAVRELAGLMKFPSKTYNMAKQTTWSNPEDLVFLTTPKYMAEIDVDVLATAFNVSSTDLNVRTILVDELPKQMAKTSDLTSGQDIQECYGILMDKDFIQVWDTVNESRTFENGRALMTNMFLHKQGILANCYFANCVALVKKLPA